jgi:hypothetical protein
MDRQLFYLMNKEAPSSCCDQIVYCSLCESLLMLPQQAVSLPEAWWNGVVEMACRLIRVVDRCVVCCLPIVECRQCGPMCRCRGAANAFRSRWILGGMNSFPSAVAAACLHPAVPAACSRGARKVLPAGSRKSMDLRPRSGCAAPAAASTASCCPGGTLRCVPGTADMDPTAIYRNEDAASALEQHGAQADCTHCTAVNRPTAYPSLDLKCHQHLVTVPTNIRQHSALVCRSMCCSGSLLPSVGRSSSVSHLEPCHKCCQAL